MDALEGFRREIDELDRQLVELIARRFKVVGKVGTYKRSVGIDPVCPARMTEVIAERSEQARILGLPPRLVEDLFETLINHAIAVEREEG